VGVASMVIGIVAAILGFVPFCNYLAALPALIGLVLGVVDVALKAKKEQPKGIGIAGVVLNGVALLLIVAWTSLFAAAAAAATSAH